VTDLFVLLAEHPLLGRLPAEDQSRLVSGGRVRTLGPLEAVCRQGEPATCFFLLIEGEGRVTRTRPDGAQQTLGRVKPGSLCGVVGLSEQLPRPATIAALGPSKVLELGTGLLHGSARSDEGRFSIQLSEILCLALNDQLRAANAHLIQAASNSGEWEAQTVGGWRR
jgi:CRP/FNR family cyclic AMP-dependent transcriptional regulator